MRFATDATLGKLGRQLRAAGFDTTCQHQLGSDDFLNTVEIGRIILSRTERLLVRLKRRPHLFIHYNDPFQQMIQVVHELGIRRHDLNPFSRCLTCNLEIHRVDKAALRGRVPAYVWQHQAVFHECAGCLRIFWAGSHHDRMRQRLDLIFKTKKA